MRPLALAQDEFANVTPARAQRHADADFERAPAYGKSNHGVDSRASQADRHRGEYGEENHVETLRCDGLMENVIQRGDLHDGLTTVERLNLITNGRDERQWGPDHERGSEYESAEL